MKNRKCIGIVALLSCITLPLTPGCVNPNGTTNNTGTGAIAGGLLGAVAGALAGARNAGQGALIGAVAGVVAGGLVGHLIDRDQQERLKAQSPATWDTIQRNETIVSQQGAAPPSNPPQPQEVPSAAPAAAPGAVTPLTLDDIKALAAAGVKKDAIKKEIDISQAKFNTQDIEAARHADPPVDPDVIEYMKQRQS